jgi:hypothetical protein
MAVNGICHSREHLCFTNTSSFFFKTYAEKNISHNRNKLFTLTFEPQIFSLKKTREDG